MKQKGFTLIELLVVITIIGLLASVVLVAINSAQSKARDVKRKADLKELSTALELYYHTNNSYPTTSASGPLNSDWWGDCSNYGSHPESGSNGWIPNLAPAYISQLPSDPRSGEFNPNASWPGCFANSSCYIYRSPNGKDYKIVALCTPETGFSSADAYYDPARPAWAWQVSSSGGNPW